MAWPAGSGSFTIVHLKGCGRFRKAAARAAVSGSTGASSVMSCAKPRSASEQTSCSLAVCAGSLASSQGFSASTNWFTRSASAMMARIALA